MDSLRSKTVHSACTRYLTSGNYLLLVFIIFFGIILIFKPAQIETENEEDVQIEYPPDNTENSWSDFPSKFHGHIKKMMWDVKKIYEKTDCNYEDYIFGQPVQQDDPCLIATFKKKYLVNPPPPPEVNRDQSIIPPELSSNIEKLRWIEKLIIEAPDYDQDQGGFFIEMGANNGTFISATIRLEMKHNWKGLLVEALPVEFKKLLKVKRNCWAVNAAACTTKHPQQITFFSNPNDTGLSGFNQYEDRGVTAQETLQCIPLYTMLAALDVETVDFFSLDIEGLEVAILKTIPFDKITFKVLAIEYDWVPGEENPIREFLEPKGYKYVKHIDDWLTKDVLYVHESLYEKANLLLKSGFLDDIFRSDNET